MIRRLVPLLLTALAGVACSSGAPPVRPLDPAAVSALPPPPRPAPAEPPADAASAKPPTLIVANDEGIREVRYDGSTVRSLSKTPARRPRILPGGKEILFYVKASGELRRLSLETGAEAVIARLPRAFPTCDKLPDYPRGKAFTPEELDIQEDGDFVVDAASGDVCLTLMDRNANMVNMEVRARIELSSGRVRHRVEIGGDCTRPPPEVPSCTEAGSAASAPPRLAQFPLASLGIPDAAHEEAIAPSGRWSVLGQLSGEGDYIHRALFLLDREKKLVYPIVPGAFPKALESAELGRLGGVQGTVDAVGESTVRWLDGEALLVDGLLVVPGHGGVDLGGDVAR